MKGAYATLLLVMWATGASAQEVTPPVHGQRATYLCEGAFGGTYTYEVSSFDDGIVEYLVTAPGNNRRRLIMPIWLLGTSLYRKDYGEGYGKGEMISGLEVFEALKPLPIGLTVNGDVRERTTGQSDRIWSYKVEVTERKPVQDPILGNTEIIVIREHRSSAGFSSDRMAHLSTEFAEIVYSNYSDSGGKKRECKLSAFDRKS